MFISLYFYITNFLFYLNNQNSKLNHIYNRFIVSSFALTIPLYLLFNYYIYNMNMLNNLYYTLFISQNSYYILDTIPSVINKDYLNLTHHAIGLILNYIGYIYRHNKTILFMTITTYLSEQGIIFFHSLMKILDYYNYKNTKFRNLTKKTYFFLMKIFLLVKIFLAIKTHYELGTIIGIVYYLQLFWNFYSLKNILF